VGVRHRKTSTVCWWRLLSAWIPAAIR